MPAAYSADIRGRVIASVESGSSRREAAEEFDVSASSAIKWVAAYRTTGSCAAKPRGGSTSPLEKYANLSEQVVQELLADPNSQWHEYRGRGPITKNQVAALLKDFEVRPVVVHPTKRADVSRHGYRAAQFEDAFARFLPPEPNIRTLKRGGGEKTRENVRMFG